MFGVPDTFQRGTYNEWVEYWLLDTPCNGKQCNGCYLGYTVDTRINNEASSRRNGSTTEVTSFHDTWRSRNRELEAHRSEVDTINGRVKLTNRSHKKKKTHRAAKPVANQSSAAVSTSNAADGRQSGRLNLEGLKLEKTSSIRIDQKLSAKHETVTTYYDAHGQQIGDAYISVAQASGDGNGSTEKCPTQGIQAAGSVADKVGDALIIGGSVLLLGSAGALGGAASGASIAALDPIPFDEAPAALVGAVVGGVSGAAGGVATGMTIVSYLDTVANSGGAVGDGTGAGVGPITETACDSSAADSGGKGPTLVETDGPGGGSGGGGTSSTGTISDNEDGEDNEDDNQETEEENDDQDSGDSKFSKLKSW